MESLLQILINCGDHFDESFVVADMENSEQPLVYINEAFSKLTGYDFDEIKGQNCRFLQGDETNPETVQQLRNSINNSKCCFFDLLNYKKNNMPFWNRLVLFPVGYSEDEVSYYVGVQINVFEGENSLQKLKSKDIQEKVENAVQNPFSQIIRASRAMKYADLAESSELPDVKSLSLEIRDEVKKISEFLKSV